MADFVHSAGADATGLTQAALPADELEALAARSDDFDVSEDDVPLPPALPDLPASEPALSLAVSLEDSDEPFAVDVPAFADARESVR